MQQCCLRVPPHHLNVSPNLWYVLIQISGGGGGRAAAWSNRTAESVFPISAVAFCGSTLRTCRGGCCSAFGAGSHLEQTHVRSNLDSRNLKRELQVHMRLLWSVSQAQQSPGRNTPLDRSPVTHTGWQLGSMGTGRTRRLELESNW